MTVDTRFDPQHDDTYAANAFFGSEVVRWNRDDNVIEPLYDLFALARRVHLRSKHGFFLTKMLTVFAEILRSGRCKSMEIL